MLARNWQRIACTLVLLGAVAATAISRNDVAAETAAVNYDIIYVRQLRKGDNEHIVWPEIFHPARIEPGSDLMLLHPNGAEEVLVAAGDGAVTDPFVSFDGQYVYYSFFPDVRPSQLNYQRDNLPYAGADIYRMHIASRAIQRLTHQEFTPNTGAGNWDESNPVDPPSQFNRLGYGILNLGPAPLPGGKIIFVSNRNGFAPPKGFTSPTLQLFVMDWDGSNVTPIAPMTIGSALHPTPLRDGRIMFSSFETHGLRDSRLWGIWTIYPDGRYWEPLVSAFKWASAFHFQTQLGNGDVVVEDYYNLNNFGFGALYRFPLTPFTPQGQPRFHSAFPNQNPPITQTIGAGFVYPRRMAFTPRGLYSISPMTHAEDEAAPKPNAGATDKQRVGKFTHPSATPNNDLLVAWSGGPVNALDRPVNLPAPDAGLYLISGGNPVSNPNQLVLIKNDPNYNEVWPRAVVPYSAVHGMAEPASIPWLPNDGSVHAELPPGTPYGLIGTSSLYKRESFPGSTTTPGKFDGLDAFNTSENDQSSNWITQGADAGKYTNADIWAVRLLAMEPNTHRSYGPNEGQHFFNHINEKLRILGEIPLRKFDPQGNPILDPEGNPDTSFLAKIPADTPVTFQMLDRNGAVLTMAQTWHQVRPGEMRADCGGCHAHSQTPLQFNQTAAGKPGYPVVDLTRVTPLLTQDTSGQPALRTVNAGVVNVEFYRDIRPILQRSCAGCHTTSNPAPPGNLVLDDLAMYPGPQFSGMSPIPRPRSSARGTGIEGQLPGDYSRLCFDSDARWGYKPLVTYVGNAYWRQTNASRYLRPLQSRRSLLIWKIFGQRMDGWTNADHPTESSPGDAGTLPAGAQINDADLDYTGTIMPPPNSGAQALSIDEKMTFARWVDLGCPINTGEGGPNQNFGWFVDDVRPALTVSSPRPGHNPTPVMAIRVGMADAYTGIAPGTLSIKSDLAINGRAPGAELADLTQPAGEGIVALSLTQPMTSVLSAHVFVEVKDQQGNITRVNQAFSVGAGGNSVPNTYLPNVRQ